MNVFTGIRFVVSALTAVLLLGCSTMADRSAPTAVAAASTTAPTPAAVTMTRLTFARAGCLGRCPGYQFELAANGEYQLGTTAAPALQRGQLASSSVTELQSLYLRVRALQLPERLMGSSVCPRFQTDMPTISMSWQTSQLRWQLQHNVGCKAFAGEAELQALESRIEALLPTLATGSER